MSFEPQVNSITTAEETLPDGRRLWWTGPSRYEGPLPALFYFFTTGQESLERDPYNQLVQALHNSGLRVFSLTVPLHSPSLDNVTAMARWSAAIQEGQNPLSNFVDAACQAVNWTIEQGLADAEHLGVAGLSRGAYIATHLAAKDPRLRHILGFAPLTDVSYLKEFSQLSEHPLVAEQKLNALIPQLLHHKLRFYIGNRDLRVGTERCFDFVHKLADAAYSARVRSPQAELFITPSIGHRGHGTSPMTFFEGAQWLREELQASSKHPWL